MQSPLSDSPELQTLNPVQTHNVGEGRGGVDFIGESNAGQEQGKLQMKSYKGTSEEFFVRNLLCEVNSWLLLGGSWELSRLIIGIIWVSIWLTGLLTYLLNPQYPPSSQVAQNLLDNLSLHSVFHFLFHLILHYLGITSKAMAIR